MGTKSGEIKLDKLFTSISLDLSNRTGRTSSQEFARQRLIQRMRKRAEYVRPALQDIAIEKFCSINDIVGESVITLPDSIIHHAADFIRFVLERHVKKIEPDSLQECFSWSYILSNWSFGPGTSNGIKGNGPVEKIDKPMTCTEIAEPYVKLIRADYPYFQGFDALNGNGGVQRVYGSRLATVLKNEDSVRTIAIEPSGNMAFQLAGGRLIEDALRGIGLDIKHQQDLNKILARLGSIYKLLCTLDLSSASDMILVLLVEKLWPGEWFNFFMKFRSPVTTLPNGLDVRMNMISTMGNGFTFPMMTLTLLALVYANRVVNHNGPYRYIDWSKTAVFGDDIIVPVDEYETLCLTLQQACLVVNKEKSYATGSFRESCGGDYYEGVDVTPFYPRSLRQASEVYVVMNQVLRWCARHDFVMFNTLVYLKSLLPSEPYLVPEWSDDFAGIRTSQCTSKYKRLRLRPVKRPYTGYFSVPLACAGYLEGGDSITYCPRSTWVKYAVGTARLPKGYLDGWDPRYGDQTFSSKISLMVSLMK